LSLRREGGAAIRRCHRGEGEEVGGGRWAGARELGAIRNRKSGRGAVREWEGRLGFLTIIYF
jgi:hypothetical protein